ncbi:SlyX family protein [Maricaulis sp.]|jgi:SlyX protein|uniref:SlyX family protein n=1 Tax=Maricaulis sp. TaxID=1486257 RepID=UPI002603BF50|nr:SlyX family protein [Maricaulis sp.]
MTEIRTDRLERLESHLAHQELTLEELNQVAVEQRQEIARLTRRIDKLMSRIDMLEEQAPLPEGRTPPHY